MLTCFVNCLICIVTVSNGFPRLRSTLRVLRIEWSTNVNKDVSPGLHPRYPISSTCLLYKYIIDCDVILLHLASVLASSRLL